MPITGAIYGALESLLGIRSFAQFTPWSIIFRIAIYITYYIILYIILYCIILYYITLYYVILFSLETMIKLKHVSFQLQVPIDYPKGIVCSFNLLLLLSSFSWLYPNLPQSWICSMGIPGS